MGWTARGELCHTALFCCIEWCADTHTNVLSLHEPASLCEGEKLQRRSSILKRETEHL